MALFPNTAPSGGDAIGDSLKKINQILSEGGAPVGPANGAVVYDAAQTLTAGQQEQVRTNIKAQNFGIQYLSASANWDGSGMVVTDGGGAYTLTLPAFTESKWLIVNAMAGTVINIAQTGAGPFDGTAVGANKAAFLYYDHASTDGQVCAFAVAYP